MDWSFVVYMSLALEWDDVVAGGCVSSLVLVLFDLLIQLMGGLLGIPSSFMVDGTIKQSFNPLCDCLSLRRTSQYDV